MVNLVYQPTTLGEMLAIYIQPGLPANRSVKQGPFVLVYHDDTLIGINLFQPKTLIANLSTGIIRRLEPSGINAINLALKKENISFQLPDFFSGFRIVEVKQIEPHPDADNLFICQVHDGLTSYQIVTNSTKVKPNQRVVVALPGAMLRDGQIIQEGMMMQVKSQGMFCSEKTLGIEPETQVGVLILPEDAVVGKDYYAQ